MHIQTNDITPATTQNYIWHHYRTLLWLVCRVEWVSFHTAYQAVIHTE